MTRGATREWTGGDGCHYRSEQWTITGGEVDPSWRRKTNSRGDDLGPHEAGWEPSSRFTLYVVDGAVDPRLASYGGVVWPPAWPELFQKTRQGTYQAAIEITDAGLMFRAAVLADVRLS
jgi:hypothetical protein